MTVINVVRLRPSNSSKLHKFELKTNFRVRAFFCTAIVRSLFWSYLLNRKLTVCRWTKHVVLLCFCKRLNFVLLSKFTWFGIEPLCCKSVTVGCANNVKGSWNNRKLTRSSLKRNSCAVRHNCRCVLWVRKYQQTNQLRHLLERDNSHRSRRLGAFQA